LRTRRRTRRDRSLTALDSMEVAPMDPSIPRPTGLRGSLSGSPPLRDATDPGPISGAAEEGPRGSRIGIARFPMWSHGRIGLRVLGLIGLTLLSIVGLPKGASSVKRVRGIGDTAILTFAFTPDGAMIATIQVDGRVALRDAAGGVTAHAFLEHHGP